MSVKAGMPALVGLGRAGVDVSVGPGVCLTLVGETGVACRRPGAAATVPETAVSSANSAARVCVAAGLMSGELLQATRNARRMTSQLASLRGLKAWWDLSGWLVCVIFMGP